MSYLLTRSAAFAAIVCAGLLMVGQASAELLRYSDYGPNRGTRAEALEWFADEINARSGGELEIEFHWGGSLLGMRATLEGLSSGVADAGTVIGFAHPQELQAYNIGDLPVQNSDVWVGLRALYDLATPGAAAGVRTRRCGVSDQFFNRSHPARLRT